MNRYHTLDKRFIASIIDVVIFLPLGLAQYAIDRVEPSTAVMIPWLLIANLSLPVYSVLMHGWYGQTLGKMAMKVKVVDHETELPITMKQAFFRESYIVAFNVVIFFVQMNMTSAQRLSGQQPGTYYTVFMLVNLAWVVAEVISCLKTPKRRSLHDFIGGTVVIRLDISQATV